jgi:hypothetical protein
MPDAKVLRIVDKMVQPRADLQMPLDARGQFTGELVTVSDSDKAIQDVVKGILTVYGTNFLSPGYGTHISVTAGKRAIDLNSQITSEVQQLLGYLTEFNKDQPASEQIVELVNLEARQSIDKLEVNMMLRTGTGATVAVVV